MHIDAGLENIVLEMERRWKSIARAGLDEEEAMRIILRNTVRKLFVLSNLVSAACGARIASTRISLRPILARLEGKDIAYILDVNRAATAQINILREIISRPGTHPTVDRMLRRFIDTAEADLDALHRLAQRSRATSA